jgi:hypothetical protein
MQSHARQGPLSFFARLAAVTAAYYLGGRLGLSIPYLGSHVSCSTARRATHDA